MQVNTGTTQAKARGSTEVIDTAHIHLDGFTPDVSYAADVVAIT